METITIVLSFSIVLTGLFLIVSAAYMAWKSIVAGAWVTFLFGFLLTLTGGPINERLNSLSLSKDSVDIVFDVTTISEEKQKELQQSVATASLPLKQNSDDISFDQQKLGSASLSFQKELQNAISALGFIPIPPTAKEQLIPGTIIDLEKRNLVVWASYDEAFPNLKTTITSDVLPTIRNLKSDLLNQTKYEMEFYCGSGSFIQQASLYSLSKNINPDLLESLRNQSSLKIIHSVLACTDYTLNARTTSDSRSEEDSLRYGNKSQVVIGVQISTIKAKL